MPGLKAKEKLRRGRLVAKLLSRAWRPQLSSELDISEAELDEATSLLHGCGAAALGWKRIAETTLRTTASAELLHQAYRLHSLQAMMHEEKIGKVFRLLRQAHVDAVMAKGWVAARLYTDSSLRPYGDIDICVRPGHFQMARQVLDSPEANDCWVDLHEKFSELSQRSFEGIWSRSRVLELCGEQIRMLGAEDHLALLCIHFLRHGAWRPLWLCDIGAATESVGADFDWGVCFGSNATRSSWIATSIALAEHLLQADTNNLPDYAACEVPAWMIENVLDQWSHPFAIDQSPAKHPIPITYLLRHPKGLFEGLRQRWPNAITATVSVNGRFNRLPRVPYQAANWIARLGHLVVHHPEH